MKINPNLIDLSSVMAIPEVLYNNTTGGTNGTVDLSETSANFNYIEIFYRQAQYTSIYSSVRVYKPNGKQVSLVAIQAEGTGAGIASAYVTISGTKITKNGYNIYWTNSGNANTNAIYITRVLGYR